MLPAAAEVARCTGQVARDWRSSGIQQVSTSSDGGMRMLAELCNAYADHRGGPGVRLRERQVKKDGRWVNAPNIARPYRGAFGHLVLRNEPNVRQRNRLPPLPVLECHS
jgi:hypothetical protein